MISLSKDAVKIIIKENEVDLEFTSLTERDKENILKEVGNETILEYVKNNFDPEDILDVEVDTHVEWSRF